MDNIEIFNKKKVVERPHSEELFDDIIGIINKHNGDLTVAEVLGVLRLVDDFVINENCRGGDND